MSRLEKILYELREMESPDTRGYLQQIDPRCKIVVTVLFLIAVLTVPLTSFDQLLWLFIVPIIMSTLAGINYSRVFVNSLFVLPFVVLIGIFNPFIDRQPVILADGIVVNRGWINFGTIVLRGLLSMQCVLILIESTGFIRLCDALRRMGAGRIVTTQLMMVYRYIGVLVTEAIAMKRACQSRGFGKESLPIKLWGEMVGRLLLRTVDRAERIHRAMISRGFDGTVRTKSGLVWRCRDTVFLIVSIAIIVVLSVFNISSLFYESSLY